MITYAIIIGLALILIFFAYVWGYNQGFRDAKKTVSDIFLEEHSSHADPTIPRDFQRH